MSSNITEDSAQPPQSRRAKKSAEAPDPKAQQAKRAKVEKIGRTVAVFIMPLMIVGMMIWGYLGAMHEQTAKNMPVVIAASSIGEAEDFAAALEQADPDAVDVSVVDSAREARDSVYDRSASASVILDGSHATLLTASAAGVSGSGAITAVITPVLLDEGLSVASDDVAPLPENDSMGMTAMLLATAMITAGYMPWSMAYSNSPELLRRKRAFPLLGGWSLLLSALGILVAGPMMGLIPAAKIIPAWGTLALGVFAVGAGQLLLTRLLGALAVIPGMFLFMVLGQPASNMGMSVYTLPKIFPFLHQFLPMPALGEAMRSVLYFNGDGAQKHLLILAGGAVAALMLTAMLDAVRTAKGKNPTPVTVNVTSLHGGPRPKNRAWRYITLGALPFGMIAIMLTSMLSAMHTPTPREMPVAVVAASMEQAEQMTGALNENMPGMFELSPMDNAEDARHLVETQELTGAFVLPSAQDPQAAIYTAQASGNAASQVVTSVFSQIAAEQQMPVQLENLTPLPEHDNMGVATMYLGMGWLMAGFMVVMVGSTAAPHLRPLKNFIPMVIGYAAFMSAVLYLIAGPFTGAVEGHFWALWGAGMLAITAVAIFTMIFNRLIGMICMLPVMLVVMFLGVPASNGALSIYMEPEIFTTLHSFLPMPAAVESIRSILYFDSVGVGAHMMTLALWALVSLAVVMVIDQLKPVKTTDFKVPEQELESLRAKVLSQKAFEAAAAANEIDEEARALANEMVLENAGASAPIPPLSRNRAKAGKGARSASKSTLPVPSAGDGPRASSPSPAGAFNARFWPR